MNITLNGKYDDVYNFIIKLENMRYYSDIISFKIKHADPSETGAVQAPIPSSDPFSLPNGNNAPKQATPPPSVDQKVSAVLDVAFYLKNNSK
jgi:hypothetical protein